MSNNNRSNPDKRDTDPCENQQREGQRVPADTPPPLQQEMDVDSDSFDNILNGVREGLLPPSVQYEQYEAH